MFSNAAASDDGELIIELLGEEVRGEGSRMVWKYVQRVPLISAEFSGSVLLD